jgi:cytochrome P450
MTTNTRLVQQPAPPSPSRAHDLGSTDESLDLMVQWFRELGDTYRVFSPARSSWTWVIHDPDDVKRVLVTNHRNYTKGIGLDRVRLLLGNGIMTSEGEFWRRQRRMMQPAFHRKVVERFAAVVRSHNARLIGDWERAARRGEAVNLTAAMSELALAIVLDAIFSADLSALSRDLDGNPFLVVTRDTRRDPQFAYAFRQLGSLVLEILRRRREDGDRPFDFTQLLLEATDPDTGQGMPERELLDEILTLVVAGHETTASALNWTWWLLAGHPGVEGRVHAEQDAVGDLGLAEFNDLSRLPYTRQVVDEAMRLYPPGWLLTRRSIGPDRLGGYDLPGGTDVLLSPYVIHRHPAHWSDPERFDPGRFDPPLAATRHPQAFLPFGVGPRHCIGENFAIYEIMVHLNAVTRRFRLRPTETTEPRMEARVNLRTARELLMQIELR